MKTTRRLFIKNCIAGTALVTGTTLINCGHSNNEREIDEVTKWSFFNDDDIVLFQGDSITDSGRNVKNKGANDIAALGKGYVLLTANQLHDKFSSKRLKIYNRGLSGNRVPDLQKRWGEDAIDIVPNVLSILIGVNDFWRTIDSGAKTTVEEYRNQYRQLVDMTLYKIPEVNLIIGEPFVIKNVGKVTDVWFPKFLAYQQAAFDVAKEFNAIFVSYQRVFDSAQEKAAGSYWAADGIHPTSAGAQIMANAWIDAIENKYQMK